MRKGKTVPLDDVCNVEYGTRVVHKRDGGKGFPVYGGGGATFEMDVFNRQDRLVIARFGMSEECTRFVGGKFFLNDSGLTVSPKSGLTVQRFLDYQMLSLNDDVYALGKGTAQKNLDVPLFRTLPLFVPRDLAEQHRVVAMLDEAFAGLATAQAHAEKNLQNARALFESHLAIVFSQESDGRQMQKLGDVCQTGAGGTPLKSRKEYYEGGTIPWLLSGEVSQGEIHVATKFITKQGLDNSAAKLFPKDTVLVAMYGATAGQVGVLRFRAATNQAVCGILPNKQFAPEFLYYCFLAKKDALVAQAAGNAQPNISQVKIRNTLVPVPSLAEQKRVAANLDTLATESQRLERLYQQKLAALATLKKSLLHQAFSGAL